MAEVTVVRLADQASGFLTNETASATYLTNASASSTYLDQISASTTYVTQTSASNTYLSQSSASSAYAPIIPTVPTSFRNKIINGDFSIWQRSNNSSLDISTNVTYFADRWQKLGSSGTATAFPNTLGRSELPSTESGISTYFRWWQTVAPTTAQGISTQIENVRTLNGKTVVLSFYAKLNSGGPFPFVVKYAQLYGTGGSGYSIITVDSVFKDMSGNVVTGPDSSWKRYYVSFYLPALSGNIGYGGDDHLQIQFYSPSSGTWEFDITGIQLEEGSFPTPVEVRPRGLELQLCQRYFCRSTGTSNYFHDGYLASPNSGFNEAFQVPFPTIMRSTPTVTVSFTNFDNTINAGQFVTRNGFVQYFRCSNGGFPYAGWRASFTAVSEIF